MVKSNGTLLKKLLNIIFIGMILFCFYYGLVNITYANINTDNPDVIVKINGDGRIACEGSLLGEELWYPGKEESGVIRISNNYSNVAVKGINLKVTLNSSKPGVDRDFVFESFLKNMKFTLKKGKLLVFNETLYDDRSFLYMTDSLYDAGQSDHAGPLNIKIPIGSFTDFKYTVRMDNEAGDELENLNASVDINLDLQEGVE